MDLAFRRPRFLNGPEVEFFVLQDNLTSAEIVVGVLPGSLAKTPANLRVGQDRKAAICHGIDVTDIVQEPVDPVPDDFGNTTYTRGNDGDFAGHRLQGNQTEGFQLAWKEQNVRNRQQLTHVVLLADKYHVILNSVSARQPLGLRTFGSVAHHQEARPGLFAYARKNCDNIFDSFYRAKIGYVD